MGGRGLVVAVERGEGKQKRKDEVDRKRGGRNIESEEGKEYRI